MKIKVGSGYAQKHCFSLLVKLTNCFPLRHSFLLSLRCPSTSLFSHHLCCETSSFATFKAYFHLTSSLSLALSLSSTFILLCLMQYTAYLSFCIIHLCLLSLSSCDKMSFSLFHFLLSLLDSSFFSFKTFKVSFLLHKTFLALICSPFLILYFLSFSPASPFLLLHSLSDSHSLTRPFSSFIALLCQ